MANNVFANGREIACKAAEGKSIASFPDVCFTPPHNTTPTPIGIPIPYPNTAYAKDTQGGSSTVFISGKEIMLKDKSYFKTSTGNEAAKPTNKKGMVTGKVKGKAYFTSWSMNVKVEGFNVCRHMDLTTHNHGSLPGNTGPWGYMDSAASGSKGKCKDERKAIKEKCEPSKKEKDKFKQDQKDRNKRRRKHKKPAKAVRAMHWKDKHCKGIAFLPNPEGIEKAADNLKEILNEQILDVDEILTQKLRDLVAEKTIKLAAKTGARHTLALFGGPFVAFTEIIAAVVTVLDTAYTITSGGLDAVKFYEQNKKKLGKISSQMSEIERLRKDASKWVELKGKNRTSQEQTQYENLGKKLRPKTRKATEAMAKLAKNNDCLSARRCMLRPYNDKKDDIKKGAKKGPGCCGGQTAHHLIPKSYFLIPDKKGGGKTCDSYNQATAPCVCVEGVSHTIGTHGEMHTAQDKQAKKTIVESGDLSYETAKTASIAAHQKVFKSPKSTCSKECLEAQLDAHHEACKSSDIRSVSSIGGATISINKGTTPPSTDDANFN